MFHKKAVRDSGADLGCEASWGWRQVHKLGWVWAHRWAQLGKDHEAQPAVVLLGKGRAAPGWCGGLGLGKGRPRDGHRQAELNELSGHLLHILHMLHKEWVDVLKVRLKGMADKEALDSGALLTMM